MGVFFMLQLHYNSITFILFRHCCVILNTTPTRKDDYMRFRKAITACAVAASILLGGQAASASTFDTTNSVVDYLKSVGKDSSFANREEMAHSNGVVNYIGSMEQNVQLLSILRGTPTLSVQEPIVAQPQAEGKTITVTATAYTAFCAGCSGVTATGIDLRSNPNQKVIAVDPTVIPLGSTVYVEGYGEAIAGDTGGAIKGNRIDLFIPNYANAIDFGKRTLEVTILN
jgi:3D (Asp-Asp-Asp) domain-containing protein